MTSARPLQDALQPLAQRGIAITYEDSPYLHQSEGRDVTAERNPRAKSPIFDLPSWTFSYDEPPLADRPAAAVSRVIEQFNRAQNRSQFDLVASDGVINVFPTKTLDPQGVLRPYRALLDVDITIAPHERTLMDLTDAVLRLVSPRGPRPVLYGGNSKDPLNLGQRTSIGFDHVNARSAINHIVALIRVPATWQILCAPGPGACYFAVLLAR